jgi:hypothetical protein
MKQTTTKQHYLPRYRLQHFLRSNSKYYVHSNGTSPNKKDRETGKNDSFFAVCDKLYELTEVPSWADHKNLIETDLLANDVEREDACRINKVIDSIKANNELSQIDSEWLGKYALRMLYRSPAYMKEIKAIPEFQDPTTYYKFMRFTQKDEHPNLTKQEWSVAKILLGLYSDGTIILKNPHSTFILPDSGFGICHFNNTSTLIFTPLTPSICMLTSKGPCAFLKWLDGNIVTATINEVSAINEILFACSNSEIASMYKLSASYLNKLKAIKEKPLSTVSLTEQL